MENLIKYDRERFEELKEAYYQALGEGKNEFNFQGHTMVTGYAKYLIEYLETKFSK